MQKVFGYLALLLILSSCVNKSYVPTMYEPMLLSRKGELRASFAQTSRTGKIQIAYAVKKNLGVFLTETFAKGITNTELGVSYFRKREKSYYELGGGLGYQANYINYNYRPGAGIWFFQADITWKVLTVNTDPYLPQDALCGVVKKLKSVLALKEGHCIFIITIILLM